MVARVWGNENQEWDDGGGERNIRKELMGEGA